MADDTSTDDGGLSILDLALAYARYGLRIFPVHTIEKSPMPGYGWYELASDQINHVVEDFDRAMQLWADDVSIAWALGRDGCLAIDVDVDSERIPAWMPELVDSAVINITRRGQHLIFKMPPEMTVGNGTSGFPTQGWGEVRGQGGYIIIAGPDRPGLDLGEMTKLTTFPRPDYLAVYGGPVDAVSKAELLEFANAHSTASNINMLNGVRAAIEAYTEDRNGDPAKGRHPFAVWAMCEVADESLKGFYAFKDGFRLVQDWWRSVTPPERHGREWLGICCWAVGRALAKAGNPPTESDAGDEPGSLLDDDGITLVDWHEFFTKERTDPEWLVTDLWPFGRHISIGSKAGQGKSELIQYVVSCLALGIDPWTRQERPPMRVVYLDMEMTEEDLYQRMTDFGYSVADAGLLQTNLLYAVLPVLPALNSQAGLRFVERIVDKYTPDVFIIDTFMKTLAGDENDAATVQEFTRLTGMLLKSRSIASGRADHYGKDPDKGNRGTSAKDDDVDVAWRLVRPPGSYTSKLTATKRRQGFVPERLTIERYHTADRGVYFIPQDSVIANIPDENEHDLIAVMDLLEIPLSWGRDRIRRRLVESGYEGGENVVLAEAIRIRKARGPQLRVVKDDDE
jgi:hypothetical protein